MLRRSFMRAAGVTIALPAFSSLPLSFAGTVVPADAQARKRMVCIGNMLGFYPPAFWPADSDTKLDGGLRIARDFGFGQSSASLDSIRDRLTMIQGLDHATPGGHFSIHTFLSGIRQIDAKSSPSANVTIDQFAAERVVGQTRFASLTVGSESGIHGGCQLSWTRSGTRVQPIPGPKQLFDLLFVGTSEAERAQVASRLTRDGSILDLVRDETRDLEQRLNRGDRQKLDEYLTSVRDVEQRLAMRRNWLDVPKPRPTMVAPRNKNMVEDLPILYDLLALALQTDSTRIATLEIGGDFHPRDLGVNGDYHGLSHHGQRPESIDALIKLESYQIEQFVRFVNKLSELDDAGGKIVDQTMILFGSGMGNANSHTNTNLPIVVAGGGFDHGRLLQFDGQHKHRPPLCNLFVTMLQQFGLETDRFGTSTGTLRGFA